MEAYRAIYCGLCRELGRRFGPFARLTLSYDFTFLAMLGMALDEDKPVIITRCCGVNPLHRCPHCEPNERLAFCCDIAVLMLWHKLCDNIEDGSFPERFAMRLLRPFLRGKYRRAAASQPELAAVYAAEMQRQQTLEAAKTADVDLACEPTAKMLSATFCTLTQDTAQRRVLERLGYLLGRYIYMADALDDCDKDREKGSYNPFLLTYDDTQTAKEHALSSLYLTIGELGATYELLEPKHFQPILENIIHLGLKATADELQIPRKQRRKHKV